MRRAQRDMFEFLGNRNGSVAVIFGLSVFMLFGFAALAVDFARGQSSKDALQQDLDATLLFVGSEVAKQPNGLDPQAMANDYMKGLRRQKQIVGEVTVAITQPDESTFEGTANAKVPTRLMRIFGYSDLEIKAHSQASIGQQPVEVALVLDNTASMSGSKLTALKSASKTLIDTVYKGVNADQFVKIGLVPFAAYVNVGQGNRAAPWMSVPANSSTTQNVCQDIQPSTVVPGSCHDVPYNYTVDGVPMTSTSTQCEYTFGPPVSQCSDVTNVQTWNGCAGSRDYPLNTLDQNYAVKVPGIMNVSCPTEIMPLSNDKSAAQTAIDNMVATGNTYIPAGLMWGWTLLSKDAPFDQSEDMKDGKKVRKIMVLMTDGFNTLSPTQPYDGKHGWADTAVSNQLTTELCSNIKAAKIELFTVAFEVTDVAVKSILQNCASDPSKYHDADNPQELQTAFEKIASEFNPLRLTQ